jgi:hypothetical protein
MTETKPTIGGGYFSSVKKARQALKDRAHETYEKLVKIIDMATAAGDFETAAKYAWMLLEHTPKDEGETVIDTSAAKAPAQIESGPRGPIIQIGVKVGGVNEAPKQLPEAVVIDVKPE